MRSRASALRLVSSDPRRCSPAAHARVEMFPAAAARTRRPRNMRCEVFSTRNVTSQASGEGSGGRSRRPGRLAPRASTRLRHPSRRSRSRPRAAAWLLGGDPGDRLAGLHRVANVEEQLLDLAGDGRRDLGVDLVGVGFHQGLALGYVLTLLLAPRTDGDFLCTLQLRHEYIAQLNTHGNILRWLSRPAHPRPPHQLGERAEKRESTVLESLIGCTLDDLEVLRQRDHL